MLYIGSCTKDHMFGLVFDTFWKYMNKVFGIAVKELDINQVPLEEDWMASNMEDEEESSNGDPPRKKLRLTKEQSRLLEESFRQNHTLNPVTPPNFLSLIKYVI